MLVERSLNADWLANTYLLADQPGGAAALVDAGGPVAALLDAIERHGMTLNCVLLTHHHWDHVAELDAVLERHPGTPVLIHAAERDQVPAATAALAPGEVLAIGELSVEAIHTPGHTAGMLSLLARHGAETPAVFTGDTLFKGSVGGVRAPGHTTYDDLKSSIMDRLLALDPATIVYPGHTDSTTVGDELEHNAFVRIWRGLDPEGAEPCTAMGEPATLILLGDDYDGGHKAWVRWPDGRDDIVPGSQVERG